MLTILNYHKSFLIRHALTQWRCQSTTMHCRDISKILPELAEIVGAKNVCSGESVRQQFSRDESYHLGVLPSVVVKPHTTEQVSRISRLCHKQRVPMIPFGAGTGVEGGVIPIESGVTVSLMEMNSVLEVNANDFVVTVEPGVSRRSLNTYLRDTGLWFPIDPGADASIGGMAATSASGTNAVRYGTMRENVVNLEVVLANGDIIHTAGKGFRARKTSAGYNLTNLFVGSEGTLGTITAVTLKLHAIPEMISAAVCSFPRIEDAVNVAVQILQSSIAIARVEFLDSLSMKACNAYSKSSHSEAPTLFMEFHGQPNEIEEQMRIVNEIAVANGGSDFLWANKSEERNRLWDARHRLFYAILALRPGSKAAATDVCVPISALPSVVMRMVDDIEKNRIIGTVFGHVGDGNFHAVMIFDPNDHEELDIIKGISERLVHQAWAAQGTCTGEHGIGMGKVHMLEKEIGEGGMQVMRQIKHVLDPYNVMNPGKVLNVC